MFTLITLLLGLAAIIALGVMGGKGNLLQVSVLFVSQCLCLDPAAVGVCSHCKQEHSKAKQEHSVLDVHIDVLQLRCTCTTATVKYCFTVLLYCPQDPYVALPLVWAIVGAIPLTCWALILVLGEHTWVG